MKIRPSKLESYDMFTPRSHMFSSMDGTRYDGLRVHVF